MDMAAMQARHGAPLFRCADRLAAAGKASVTACSRPCVVLTCWGVPLSASCSEVEPSMLVDCRSHAAPVWAAFSKLPVTSFNRLRHSDIDGDSACQRKPGTLCQLLSHQTLMFDRPWRHTLQLSVLADIFRVAEALMQSLQACMQSCLAAMGVQARASR